MKVMLLTPCLMLENNRECNLKAQKYALENYKGIDQFVIYDQAYENSDYLDGYTYIGHQKERQGFVKARNELLKYFYNSDYDYAVWMDGNKTVSKSAINDFNSVIKAIKDDNVEVDVILSTLGILISPERMEIKKRPDYFKNVYLLFKKHEYRYMHGMFMKNFKKYYNDEVYISEECDNFKGVPEDEYFIDLLRCLYKTYLCPTIVINTPSNKTSTWMNDQNGYDYPKSDKIITKEMAQKEASNHKVIEKELKNVYKLNRIKDETIDDLKPYKKRGK